MTGMLLAVVVVGVAVGLAAGISLAAVLFRTTEFAEEPKGFAQKDKRQQKLVEDEVSRNPPKSSALKPALAAGAVGAVAGAGAVAVSGTSQVSSAISQLPVDDVTEMLSRQLARSEELGTGLPLSPVVSRGVPNIDEDDFDADVLASQMGTFADPTPSFSPND
jgi:hypothetical protein